MELEKEWDIPDFRTDLLMSKFVAPITDKELR